MNLENIGWSVAWKNAFDQIAESTYMPGRISREHWGAYHVIGEFGERMAEISGHFRHCARSRGDFPAVGDWVALEIPDELSRCLIHNLLPRFSSFTRRAAGTASEEQVVASNVDTVFLVSGLDHDFNSRRIERYLTLAYESGAEPVIVLNKVDLTESAAPFCELTRDIAYGVPILPVSAITGSGLDRAWEYLPKGTTAALLGSSGVGKSSLVNALLRHDLLKTNTVREHDSHGRHTTTHRQLIPLPNGSVIIDTPGMRELQLFADTSSIARSFDDIVVLAAQCRFRDCSHTNEPGCAVMEAIKKEELAPERYESYLKQCKEVRHHQIAQDVHLQIEEKNRWKAIYKSMKHHHKNNRYE